MAGIFLSVFLTIIPSPPPILFQAVSLVLASFSKASFYPRGVLRKVKLDILKWGWVLQRVAFDTKRIKRILRNISLEVKRVKGVLRKVRLDIKYISFDTKRIVFDIKRIVFDIKRIKLEVKNISFDIKRVRPDVWRYCGIPQHISSDSKLLPIKNTEYPRRNTVSAGVLIVQPQNKPSAQMNSMRS